MKQIASLLTFMFCVALFCGLSGCGSKQKTDEPAENEPVGVQELDIKPDTGG